MVVRRILKIFEIEFSDLWSAKCSDCLKARRQAEGKSKILTNQNRALFLVRELRTWSRDFSMSKIIPLPNFYKQAENAKKQRKMQEKQKREARKKKGETSAEIPPLTEMDQTKPRSFSAITTLANNFTKKVKEEQDTAEKLDLLKKGIHEALKTFVSIAFEKAEVNDLISNDPAFQHLQFFDPTAIFTADMDKLQVAKVLSLISNLQETVTKLVEAPKSVGSNLDEKIVKRLETVSGFKQILGVFFAPIYEYHVILTFEF